MAANEKYLTKSETPFIPGTGENSAEQKTYINNRYTGNYAVSEGTASAYGDYSHAEGSSVISYGYHGAYNVRKLTETEISNINMRYGRDFSGTVYIALEAWEDFTYLGLIVYDASKDACIALIPESEVDYFGVVNYYGTVFTTTTPISAVTSTTNTVSVDLASPIYGAFGMSSHVEGGNTFAKAEFSHAEGQETIAKGNASHAEGYNTAAQGTYSHAEGQGTIAKGNASHAEGYNTHANGIYSHAEGQNTTASGDYSHAEGNSTTASGLCSHTEGQKTTASGDYSHAEGNSTTASEPYSHAEGHGTTASGYYSHSGGYYSSASTSSSFAHGYYVLASAITRGAAALGAYNAVGWVKDVERGETSNISSVSSSTYNCQIFFSIGCGTGMDASGTSRRKNAFFITTKGAVFCAYNSAGTATGQYTYVNSTGATESTADVYIRL